MTVTTGAELAADIRRVLGSHSEPLVASYFSPENRFTGTTFTTLAPNLTDAFGASDVLAASLLDVPFLPRAVRVLLQDESDRFSGLLAAVPDDVDLWNATEEQLAPAYPLWTAVRELDGIGRTRASKLLARKRPRLIPVVDGVLREAFAIDDRQTPGGCIGTPWHTRSSPWWSSSRASARPVLAPTRRRCGCWLPPCG